MQIQTEITLTPMQEKQIALKWFQQALRDLPNESIEIANVDDKKILNIKEAAKFLEIGETKLRRFCTADVAPYFKRGHAYAFHKDELWDWFKTKPKLPLTEKEKEKIEHEQNLLGVQWVKVEAVEYMRKGERNLRHNQIQFTFKTLWDEPRIIKKTVSEEYKFIITDTFKNLEDHPIFATEWFKPSGEFYDDFMKLRKSFVGRRVKLEITKSKSAKFPYNCGTPLDFDESVWIEE